MGQSIIAGSITLDSKDEWASWMQQSQDIDFEEDVIVLTDSTASFSISKSFRQKTKFHSVTIKQSPIWDSWKQVAKVTPPKAENAPVFIPVSVGNYWLLARHMDYPGEGYHAWQSSDMVTWSHYGLVTRLENKWVTTAEYVEGKFYIYFDKPNDEDPHLIIDEDLTDGKQGTEIGLVFDDPSHGSDIGIIRNTDGFFHMIYEDWSPINAREHSWDSPLAGHTDSTDGIQGFTYQEYEPAIDERTTPTGIIKTYEPHPNQLIEGKDLSPYTYELHEGEQNAYGDFTLIKVGETFYLFCDYEPSDKGKSIRVGRWRTDDICKTFVWDGEIGEGFHPDPTVGFANGKFYLLVQRNDFDFVSKGPWVDGVKMRVGIDATGDGQANLWTQYTQVKEQYHQHETFKRVVNITPATLELDNLPEGYGITLEFLLKKDGKFSPAIDSVEISYSE